MLTLNSAYADGSNNSGGESNILNGQVDFNTQQATLNLSANEIQSGVTGAATAGGNAIDITTMNNTNVTNSQYVGGVAIGADTYTNISNVGGAVSMNSQAVCNSASISMDPTSTNVYSSQECAATDPEATMHANVSNVVGDVSLASQAVGNTMEEDTNAPFGTVQNYQINHSAVNTSTNVNTSNVAGAVSASATSIGNTGQIIHYTTN
jgi:hypothetical protein